MNGRSLCFTNATTRSVSVSCCLIVSAVCHHTPMIGTGRGSGTCWSVTEPAHVMGTSRAACLVDPRLQVRFAEKPDRPVTAVARQTTKPGPRTAPDCEIWLSTTGKRET